MEGTRENGPISLPPGILCFGNGVGKTSPSISCPNCPLINLYYFSKTKLEKVHNARGYRFDDYENSDPKSRGSRNGCFNLTLLFVFRGNDITLD